MRRFKFGDVVKEVKAKVDRNNNPYEFYVAGDHMDTEDLTIRRRGLFATDDVGPAFIREFHRGQILYGSRRTYLKKVAVADFDGVTANTTFVLETINEGILRQKLIPFIMLSEGFTAWSITKSKGSTNPYVLFSDIAAYEFDLPDIEVQDELVKVLWSIVETRDSYKNLLKKTDELVKSQFMEMFGGEEKSSYIARFEDAFIIRDDLRKPINDAVRANMHTGALYPYYGANGQVDQINDYLMDCKAICLAEDCGSYGAGEATSYIVSGKCWVNNHVHVLIPKDCCDIEFANVYFWILDMTEYVSGTTRLKLTQGRMREIPMIIPPKELQEQFAAFVRQTDKSKLFIQRAKELILPQGCRRMRTPLK